jgi:hypothetical protein
VPINDTDTYIYIYIYTHTIINYICVPGETRTGICFILMKSFISELYYLLLDTDAWRVRVSSKKGGFHYQIGKEISKIRHATIEELKCFEKYHVSSQSISNRILFLFIKDLTSGITRKIIDVKYQQEHMKRRETHYLLKIFLTILFVGLSIGMLVYLYLFARLQDQDRQQAWFYSVLLWLGLEVFFLSSAVVMVQHVIIPSFIIADFNAIIHNLSNDKASKKPSFGKSQVTVLAEETIFGILQQYQQPPPMSPAFNAATFVFLSQRLAMSYPHSQAGNIIFKYSTVWPRGSNRLLMRDEEGQRTCCCSSGFRSILFLMLSLPLQVQESLFRFLSTVLIGVLIYIHVYLYNMFPALVVGPFYVALFIWLIVVVRARKKRNKVKSRKANTVIQVRPRDVEAGPSCLQATDDTNILLQKQPPEVSKRSVRFLSPTVTMEDDEHNSNVVDMDTNASTMLTLMSTNMSSYERFIVQDVLKAAVEEVHERGMDYFIDDKRAYFRIIDTIADTIEQTKSPVEDMLHTIDAAFSSILVPEEEALSNLNSVMSILETTKEGSMQLLDRNSIDSVNSFSQVSNFDINTGLSFDLTEPIPEDKNEHDCEHDATSKLQTIDDNDGDNIEDGDNNEDDAKFYPAGQLEEDELTVTSAGRKSPGVAQMQSSHHSKLASEHGQSCELVSIVIEEQSYACVENREVSLCEVEPGQHEVDQCSVMSPLEKLEHHPEVEEQAKDLLQLGGSVVMQEQKAGDGATNEGEQQVDMLGVVSQEGDTELEEYHAETQQEERSEDVEAAQRQQETACGNGGLDVSVQLEGQPSIIITEDEEEKRMVKTFIDAIFEKYFYPSSPNTSQSHHEEEEETVVTREPSPPPSSPATSKMYETRKANRTTYFLSPSQKIKRKDKLLSDAEQMLTLSQTKKRRGLNESIDADTEMDIDIVPVFSAWCDDVFEELNLDDHKDHTRKIKRTSNEGRTCSGSPINHSKMRYKTHRSFPTAIMLPKYNY